jgi:hypothetical protein
MLTITATFDLIILYFVAGNVVAILLYVLWHKRSDAAVRRDLGLITAAVTGFFRENGEAVAINCMREPGGRGYVALIDSPPSKRFRYSHIVADFLCSHVQKACGLELSRVYWRFPLRAVPEAPAAIGEDQGVEALVPAGDTDSYLNLGVAHVSRLPQYEVTETSWENFRELVTRTPGTAHRPGASHGAASCESAPHSTPSR